MSLVSETGVACAGCGAEHKIKVYRSINVSLNPELKEGVRDGSLFVWTCPECGKANLMRYETLYHDPDRKLMVWLLPCGDMPQSEMSAIMNHTEAMGGYTLRRVSDITSLMEKVLINDAGLDDIIIEMCKFVTRMELAAKASSEQQKQEFEQLPMNFFKTGNDGSDGFITLTFPSEGKMLGLNIGMNVYDDCKAILERNPDIKVEEGFAKVDRDWLKRYINY